MAFSAISWSNTARALNWMPSWFTYTHAGVLPSYCFGTYTQQVRDVPGNTLLLSKVNWRMSPLGTSAFFGSSFLGSSARAASGTTSASRAADRHMGRNPSFRWVGAGSVRPVWVWLYAARSPETRRCKPSARPWYPDIPLGIGPSRLVVRGATCPCQRRLFAPRSG